MREILYGRQPVRETLRAKRRQVFTLLLAQGIKPGGVVRQILTLAEQNGVPVQNVNRRELDKMGGEVNHVQDPQNLGSLLRTAEAAGVHGVVIPDRRAAGVTPAAVRASAGAAEQIRVAQVTNLVRAMEQLKAEGVWMAGLEAAPDAQIYTEADLSGPLGLVVGSEGQGLARLVRERCDYLIRLPMLGQVESLNAAVAGAIALYEARRQRG
jgi:23S rRNA (guanosine2251-2'-O)-methyltransferase